MALWMNRAGRHGESEQRFLDDNRIYLQWTELNQDLRKTSNKSDLRKLLQTIYSSAPQGRVSSYLGQIWIFVNEMQIGDWVGLPSKFKRVIHFGEITGNYEFVAKHEPRLRHYRSVKWFAPDIPREKIPRDILYSFGAAGTICGIDAESRIRAMAANDWKPEKITNGIGKKPSENDEPRKGDELPIDLEEAARDQIAQLIGRKYKGHGMAALVEALLKAQGYTTHRSPEGPDFGIDILAAPGPLGFGQPRLVVQVKSGDGSIDRPAVDQLIGTMQNVHAEQGLFVSWGGFKSSVDKERARQFFRVRLWDQNALIDQILENYNNLDEEFRAELPLKRIWTIAQTDESTSEESPTV